MWMYSWKIRKLQCEVWSECEQALIRLTQSLIRGNSSGGSPAEGCPSHFHRTRHLHCWQHILQPEAWGDELPNQWVHYQKLGDKPGPSGDPETQLPRICPLLFCCILWKNGKNSLMLYFPLLSSPLEFTVRTDKKALINQPKVLLSVSTHLVEIVTGLNGS